MNNFYNTILQPSILKLSDNIEIPENLRNKYIINVNLRVNTFLNESDVPRIYLLITDNLVQSVSEKPVITWYKELLLSNNIYEFILNGTEIFVPGVDYYINDTTADLIRDFLYNLPSDVNEDVDDSVTGHSTNERIKFTYDITLPNYLNNLKVTEYFIEHNFSNWYNLDYLYKLNYLDSLDFSEDIDIIVDFFNIILSFTEINDSVKEIHNNKIYQTVMEYFVNGKYDSVLEGLLTIMNVPMTNTVYSKSGCGCDSGNSENTANNEVNCADKYKEAMNYLLIKMLSDPEFYKDWMFLTDEDKVYSVNETVIDPLIKLLEMVSVIDLSFSKNNYNTCQNKLANIESKNNSDIIKEYIELLKTIKDLNCIDDIVNRINIVGSKFGNLLIKL